MQPPPLPVATGNRNCGRWLRYLLALVTVAAALLGWSFSSGALYSASVSGLSGGALHLCYFGFGTVPYDSGGNIPMPAGTNPGLMVALIVLFYILFSLLVYGDFSPHVSIAFGDHNRALRWLTTVEGRCCFLCLARRRNLLWNFLGSCELR